MLISKLRSTGIRIVESIEIYRKVQCWSCLLMLYCIPQDTNFWIFTHNLIIKSCRYNGCNFTNRCNNTCLFLSPQRSDKNIYSLRLHKLLVNTYFVSNYTIFRCLRIFQNNSGTNVYGFTALSNTYLKLDVRNKYQNSILNSFF